LPQELLFDVKTVADAQVLYDQAEIMKVNPQRFEMPQLSAIVYFDTVQQLIVGYKDVSQDEFWVRGHMPNYPLLPGGLMCEAAAQLTGFYSMKANLVHGEMIVFSGMNNVRFRGRVNIGERLWLVGKVLKINRRKVIFAVQGMVSERMVFEAEIVGMPFTPGTDSIGE
jgi:3-hydroxyacyl-[acyl-carrier-protein] dehydratase